MASQKLVQQSEFHRLARAGSPRGVGVIRPTGKLLPLGDEDDHTVPFIFSDGSVDLMSDTLDANGWVLDSFRANAVVPWCHDTSAPPIGRAPGVYSDGTQLRGSIEFATAEVYDFADTIYRLVRAGFVRGCSVGFLPLEWKWSSDPARPGGIDYKRQRLLEVSVCPLPANQNSLAQARSIGIDTRPLSRWAERALDSGGAPGLSRNDLARLSANAKEPPRQRSRAADLARARAIKARIEGGLLPVHVWTPPPAPSAAEAQAEAERCDRAAGVARAMAALAWW